MQPRRPAGVLVIAIFCIFVGSMEILCSGGIAAAPVGVLLIEHAERGAGDPPPAISFGDSSYDVATWALSVVSFILGPFILIAGLGLLGMRPWARRLALVSATILLIVLILQLGMICAGYVTLNWHEKDLEDVDPADQGVITGMMHGALIGIVLVQLVWIAFAVSVITVLTRPAIKQAFEQPREPVVIET